MRLAWCNVLSVCVAFGQTPVFDVASVKPAPPYDGGVIRVGSSGGPGTKDPGLFKCENCSLADLITQAFMLKRYQLTAPDWTGSERFYVSATMPADTTKEQFRLMLQNLLAERFHLTIHHEQKEMATYDLVAAKGGSKLKESVPVETAPETPRPAGFDADGKPKLDSEGFPVLPAGSGPMSIMMNGKARSRWINQTIEQFAATLANQVGKPVTDRTGLTGKYDLTLSWTFGGSPRATSASSGDGGVLPAVPEDSGQDIFAAIQSQLGLKLEQKRGLVEITVVDHAEKVPSEN